MDELPPPLAARWHDSVARDGWVQIATLTHAQVRAAGLVLAEPGREGGGDGSLATSFDGLPADEQAAAVARAMQQKPDDREAWDFLREVTTSPLWRGWWVKTPDWFLPTSRSAFRTTYGISLPDGSVGLLAGDVDLASAVFVYSVRTVANEAKRCSDEYFRPSAALPDGQPGEDGWSDAKGGAIGQLTLVWPKGRGTRATTWQVTRTDDAMDHAFVQFRNDYGFRRSTDATLDAAALTDRLGEAYHAAAAQSLGR